MNERWDINCRECGKYILTEEMDSKTGDIKCIAGAYTDGYYDPDGFLCKKCAQKRGYKLPEWNEKSNYLKNVEGYYIT